MKRQSYRRLPALSGVLAGSLLLAACGSDASGDGDGSSGDNSVTFGVIAPMEGAFGEIGENIVAGFELGVEHAQAAGIAAEYDVTVEVKDEQADAQAATQAARDFLSDDVDLIAGMLTTPACSAVAPVVEQAGGVLVTAVCAGNDISGAYTGEAPHSRTFAMAPRDSMVSIGLAEALAEKIPHVTEYNVFGYDYNWGRETWETYRDTMLDRGVDLNVNQEFWVPLGETNFRAQVSALSRGLGAAEESAVFLSTYGAGSTAFLQQAEAFDVASNVEIFVSGGGYYPVARQLDGTAPEMWNAYDYNYMAHDSDVNDAFIEGVEAELGMKPVSWTYEGYNAALAYMNAIEEAGSTDPDAVRDALETIEFEGPLGEVAMDPDTHQLLTPVVITHSVGNPDAPEGVEIIETVAVPAEDVLP